MIFVTVGTEKYPFDRLIRIMDDAINKKEIDHEVFAQIGSCIYKPKYFSWKTFISYDSMKSYIGKSDITISHAGEGTTLLCLSLDKVPIVMPRQGKEHVDDHQVELANKLGGLGKVLVSYTRNDLIAKIQNYDELVKCLNPYNSYRLKKQLIYFLNKKCEEVVISKYNSI